MLTNTVEVEKRIQHDEISQYLSEFFVVIKIIFVHLKIINKQ